ncbi:hypothetical protein [uncultured Selenomonas sp.]|nr:hypothetical protein [uncultured Selenomonas sp.]
MPEALESYLGYYIYFWIGDGVEPVHVHVAVWVGECETVKVKGDLP